MEATSTVRPRGGAAPHVDTNLDPSGEARLASLMRMWWCEERPAWTDESWWDTKLDDDVRRLLWLAPGPRLATALAELMPGSACPVVHADDRMWPDWPTPGHAPGWPCACQIVTAAAWEACAAWVAARSASALVTAAGSESVEFDIGQGLQPIQDPAREELAHALRTSIPAMGNRISAARALTSHSRLLLLVESAAISAWAGRLVLDHLTDLEVHDADKVIEDVETRIRRRLGSGRRPYNSAEVNRLARAARLRVCPETAQEGRVRAFSTRRVTVHPGANGMATLVADLADVDAHRIHRRLTAIAAGLQADAAADGTSESRTRDQLRADILTDLLIGAGLPDQPADPQSTRATTTAPHECGTPSTGGSAGGSRPEIQVLVTLETLLGLADDPAEVPGIGPVPADLARALAADGTWRAWIADAEGTVTATGTRGYVPSAGLARLVRAREPHCRFPGCRQPSMRCDLDHAVPWPTGKTTAANLGPLCRRHHNFKTHTPWALDPSSGPNGSATGPATVGWRWRTPAGFTITDGPEPRRDRSTGPSQGRSGIGSGDGSSGGSGDGSGDGSSGGSSGLPLDPEHSPTEGPPDPPTVHPPLNPTNDPPDPPIVDVVRSANAPPGP